MKFLLALASATGLWIVCPNVFLTVVNFAFLGVSIATLIPNPLFQVLALAGLAYLAIKAAPHVISAAKNIFSSISSFFSSFRSKDPAPQYYEPTKSPSIQAHYSPLSTNSSGQKPSIYSPPYASACGREISVEIQLGKPSTFKP